MRTILESIEGEYLRYRALAESALEQLDDSQLQQRSQPGDNSVAILVAHLAGNLHSRFSDFLHSDGEKPWRDREGEFAANEASRALLLEAWQRGWTTLLDSLHALNDEDLQRTVTIRAQALRVDEALHRSLAHAAYHVGQIVLLAKSMRGESWRSLSIPPGGSVAYNKQPDAERARDHARRLG